MQDLINKKILLAVSGGIAAYKSAYLARELIRAGAEVKVVMTESAEQFITPLTFQALTGNEVRTALFDAKAEQAMGHIELARWADYLVIAPASANCLAKLAHGLADDLLSTLYLVAEIPVILCPAMNQSMWRHPATKNNCALLQERGALIVEPAEGLQACGEYGLGRLSEIQTIVNHVRLQGIQNRLCKKHVLITAGSTREAIDPVRFIANRSSGKMGYALAEAAKVAGAKVTLISGPTQLTCPSGIEFYAVNSAKEMHEQVLQQLAPGVIFIACAAVADFTPAIQSDKKIKKHQTQDLQLSLTLNPDILLTVAETGKASYVVGFAAETEDLLKNAQKKLKAKKADMIIANLVGKNQGFEQDTNQVTVITAKEQIELPLAHKITLAGQLIAIIAANLHNPAF